MHLSFVPTMLILASISTGAAAHAHLISATPPVDSEIKTAPADLAISYSEGVEPKFSSIVVQDERGVRVDTGDVHLAPGTDKRLVVGLKPLPPGAYKVIWHATATDTHKTDGSFGFTVRP